MKGSLHGNEVRLTLFLALPDLIRSYNIQLFYHVGIKGYRKSHLRKRPSNEILKAHVATQCVVLFRAHKYVSISCNFLASIPRFFLNIP